jgi:hypothetical protein
MTHVKRIQSCRSCAAPIIWFRTSAGNWMPVNAETVMLGDVVLDLPRHISHFATCKNADQHRKRGTRS